MTTRIIAVILAAVLAVVGAILLITYVRGADERAFDGAELTEVLVVQSAIPAGADGATLGTAVSLQAVPMAYVAEGAVTDVAELAGRVAAVGLVPGEQVIESRFVEPGTFGEQGGRKAVPDGLQEIALSIDIQRVVGGSVVAGDLVGVYASIPAEAGSAASTQLIESEVLVTSVTLTEVDPTVEQTQGAVLVTLAVDADQAQKLVYAAEFGQVYLSHQTETSTAPSGGPVTREAFDR